MTDPQFQVHITFEETLTAEVLKAFIDHLSHEHLEITSTQEEVDAWLDEPEDAVVKLVTGDEPPLDIIALLSERYPGVTVKVWYSCLPLHIEAIAHYRGGYMIYSDEAEDAP